MVNNTRHPDPVADADNSAPKELRLYATGSWLMGTGAAATTCLWALNLHKPLPPAPYGVAVTIGLMAFLAGLMFTVISNTGRWVVKAIGRQQDEAAERQVKAFKDVADTQAQANREIAARLTGIAVSVGNNGYLARQVLAARTVDLQAMSDQIEGTARNLTVNAIEDLKKSSAAQHDALTEEFRQVKLAIAQAYVDSLGDNPAQLRAVPSPRGRWTQEQP